MSRLLDASYPTHSSERLRKPQCTKRNPIERTGAVGIYDFDYAGACRPTEDLLDGFVDCVASANGDVAFLIGQATDVSDPDTFSNSLILHCFRAAVAMGRAIDSRLAYVLNEIVSDSRAGKSAVTFFCAQYVSETKIFQYCNAGHKFPLLVRSNPLEVFRLDQGGPALGVEQTARYREGSFHTKRGDRLLVCTQGVVESWATPDDVAAEAALIRILRDWGNESAVDIAKLIVDCAPAIAGNSQIDRIAIVSSIRGAGAPKENRYRVGT
jgi:sigma-B regulation protein RsbU (phosphoserine phosphatase)